MSLPAEAFVVLDVDGEEGFEWLADRELPPTLTCTTGRGFHFYYRGTVPGRIGLGDKVDLLGDRRFVVAPPSLHVSGRRYEWIEGHRVPIADAPEWLYEAASVSPTRAAKKPATPPKQRLQASRGIYDEGTRNDSLFLDGCKLRRRTTMSEAAITAALLVTNQERCRPPLDESEVRETGKSAYLCPRQLPEYGDIHALGLTPTELAVFVALLANMNVMGETTMSYGVLAEQAGVSPSTAIRAVNTLREANVIDPIRQPFRSNRYLVCDVDVWKSAKNAADQGDDVATASVVANAGCSMPTSSSLRRPHDAC